MLIFPLAAEASIKKTFGIPDSFVHSFSSLSPSFCLADSEGLVDDLTTLEGLEDAEFEQKSRDIVNPILLDCDVPEGFVMLVFSSPDRLKRVVAMVRISDFEHL